FGIAAQANVPPAARPTTSPTSSPRQPRRFNIPPPCAREIHSAEANRRRGLGQLVSNRPKWTVYLFDGPHKGCRCRAPRAETNQTHKHCSALAADHSRVPSFNDGGHP